MDWPAILILMNDKLILDWLDRAKPEILWAYNYWLVRLPNDDPNCFSTGRGPTLREAALDCMQAEQEAKS